MTDRHNNTLNIGDRVRVPSHLRGGGTHVGVIVGFEPRGVVTTNEPGGPVSFVLTDPAGNLELVGTAPAGKR